MVDTADLKSAGVSCAGSSPAGGIAEEIYSNISIRIYSTLNFAYLN